MSVGGSSNLGTLLIRRLDTALSVQASQQSQIVNAARSDAIAQLADASRIQPLDNDANRPLPEVIEKVQAQRQNRLAVEHSRQLGRALPGGVERPTTETSSTPSAPTTLGHAAKSILALLARFPGQAPALNGRLPLFQPATSHTGTTPAAAAASSPAEQSAARQAATSPASNAPGTSTAAPQSPAAAASLAATAGTSADSNALAALFVRALSLTLQQSGLFYESHLRDLAFGARPAAELKLEPQGQLGRPAATSPAPGGTNLQTTAQAETSTSEPRNLAGNTSAGPQGGALPSAPNTLAGLHPETHLLVRQQLEVLATQLFGWRGEAWPEAPMEWEVSRHNEQQIPDEAGTHWATRLKLSLPALGEVEARLSLHDKQVVMQIVAPQSAQTLAQHDQSLRSGFHEAGLLLSQLSIRQDNQA